MSKEHALDESPSPPKVLSAANIAAFAAVLWLNALAGSGAMSGESIGRIANDYPSFFLPANYTFGIWSLIYVGLLGFTVYQASPFGRRSAAVRSVGSAWSVSCALNVAWIVAFSFRLFGFALFAMVGLLVTLIVLHERVLHAGTRLRRIDHVFVVQPFVIYLAWISVALISNTFQLATYLDWRGFGIAGEVWSVTLMTVATALGVFMLIHRRAWAFPLVVAWALVGIAQRYPEILLISLFGYLLAGLSLIAPPALLALGKRGA